MTRVTCLPNNILKSINWLIMEISNRLIHNWNDHLLHPLKKNSTQFKNTARLFEHWIVNYGQLVSNRQVVFRLMPTVSCAMQGRSWETWSVCWGETPPPAPALLSPPTTHCQSPRRPARKLGPCLRAPTQVQPSAVTAVIFEIDFKEC